VEASFACRSADSRSNQLALSESLVRKRAIAYVAPASRRLRCRCLCRRIRSGRLAVQSGAFARGWQAL